MNKQLKQLVEMYKGTHVIAPIAEGIHSNKSTFNSSDCDCDCHCGWDCGDD